MLVSWHIYSLECCFFFGRGVFVCFVLFLSHDKQYLTKEKAKNSENIQVNKTGSVTTVLCEKKGWIPVLIFLSFLISNSEPHLADTKLSSEVSWQKLYCICCLLQILLTYSRLWWFKLWKLWAGSIETYSHIILVYIVQNLLPHLWFFFLVCWMWDKLSVHVV